MNRLAPSSYKKLVSDIVCFYDTARKSQVEFYWNTGRRIVEVEQGGKARARRNAGLIQKLSEDLTKRCGSGFSERNLLRMRGLYLAHPKSPTSADINWSHHVEMLSIESKSIRERLAKKVIREGLPSLTESERRFLRKASAKFREAREEVS